MAYPKRSASPPLVNPFRMPPPAPKPIENPFAKAKREAEAKAASLIKPKPTHQVWLSRKCAPPEVATLEGFFYEVAAATDTEAEAKALADNPGWSSSGADNLNDIYEPTGYLPRPVVAQKTRDPFSL